MTYRTQAEDTDPGIEALLIEKWRKMPPWEKARQVGELSKASRELAMAGLRKRHPGAGEEELRLRLAALFLDRETMIRAYGWDPEGGG